MGSLACRRAINTTYNFLETLEISVIGTEKLVSETTNGVWEITRKRKLHNFKEE